MKIGDFDTDERVFVVAEIGNNHEGNLTLAEEMIGLAADAGADAVKFQTFLTEHYVSSEDSARFEMLKSFELTFKEFEHLKEAADKAGVIFISTPFDISSAEFLNTIVPAFKISSGDNTFYPLIETIARFGKPIILSSGLAGIKGLEYVCALIEHIWNEECINTPDLAVLHCVSIYPVTPREANLGAIRALGKRLGCVIGYSDHTLGIDAAALSVAVGARIVEKHFTKDKKFSDFRDHQLSADPNELKTLVERIRAIEELLGTGDKIVQESEKQLESFLRRSIVATRDLSAGETVASEDITWIRPAGGISPGREELVLGKILTRNVAKGERLTSDILKTKKEL
jgi:N,N'-diacetyllegionaminate synthase